MHMRIALGMHIALGAIDARRHIEHGHDARRLEVTGLAGLHLGVAGGA
jgi:hypothetical protein